MQWESYKKQILEQLAAGKFARVYGHLQDAKPSGDGWMLARCPLHEDKNPSFGYSTATGQWKCFSRCGSGDVFEFLARTTGRSFREVLTDLGDQLGVERPSRNGDGTIIYEYRDAQGVLLYQVLRGPNKKFWQRRPDGNGGWINDLKGVHPILYRLPELLARPDETVFVVEGEKDADCLHRAGALATTSSGGAGKWRLSLSESLRGRHVVILPDNDAPGRDHARQVARGVHGLAASARIVPLPGLPEKGDISDWLDAGHTLDELHALIASAPEWHPAEPAPGRPQIVVNDHQQSEIVQTVWRTLLAQNEPPALFCCQGRLARLEAGEGQPTIQFLGLAEAYGILIRSFDWLWQKGGREFPSKPPKEVAGDLIANPHPGLPQLEAVVTTPVFDAQWRLLTTPGYHPGARLWLHLTEDPAQYEVAVRPSPEDVDAARALILDDLLVDFPFVRPSDLAHAVAAIVLLFARRMFEGPTPIHLVEAAMPGAGKSLLLYIIAVLFLGDAAGSTTLTDNEEESRKKITALLSIGAPIITIDNVHDGLRSAQIAAAITTERWRDRLLGQTKIVTFRNRALWLVSANNPNLSLEIARRCVRIRLDPGVERPWTRTGFKHDPILEWVRDNRPALVRAVLTIIRSWIAAGAPQGKRTLGSFETWSRMIGGMIAHLGLPGFLGDTEEFYDAADSESGEWAALVTLWRQQYGESPVGVRELLELAEANDLVAFARVGQSDQGRRTRFGKALNSLRGRTFGDVEVVIAQDGHAKKRQYRLRAARQELFPVGGESE